jgi:hypothetical protein
MPYYPAHPPAVGRPKQGSVDNLVLPGVEVQSAGSGVFTPGTNILYYMPIYVDAPLTVTGLVWEQTAVSAAGKTARTGLYAADVNYQPTGAPLVDSGTIATDGANGVKESTVSVPLAAGRYLIAWHSDGGVTVRFVRGGQRLRGLNALLTANFLPADLSINTTYGVFASTPVAWAGLGGFGTSLPAYYVFLRVTP